MNSKGQDFLLGVRRQLSLQKSEQRMVDISNAPMGLPRSSFHNCYETGNLRIHSETHG